MREPIQPETAIVARLDWSAPLLKRFVPSRDMDNTTGIGAEAEGGAGS